MLNKWNPWLSWGIPYINDDIGNNENDKDSEEEEEVLVEEKREKRAEGKRDVEKEVMRRITITIQGTPCYAPP